MISGEIIAIEISHNGNDFWRSLEPSLLESYVMTEEDIQGRKASDHNCCAAAGNQKRIQEARAPCKSDKS